MATSYEIQESRARNIPLLDRLTDGWITELDGMQAAAEIGRLRAALQKIADLPLIDIPTHKNKTPPRQRARFLAIRALGAPEQEGGIEE